MKQLCKRERIVVSLMLALLLAGFGPIHQVYAATINVTTFADNLALNGDCSLREAIQAANTDTAVDACPAGSGAAMDTIQLSAGTYTRSLVGANEDLNQTGDLDIIGDLTIVGSDLFSTYIDASSLDRAFNLHPGINVVLKGISIINGLSSAGGGMYNDHAALSITRLTVTNNTSTGDGGGIFNSGGVLSLYESTVGDNHADGNGSGIENTAGSVQIIKSTINNNTASGNGSGIHNDAQLLVDKAWIHDNSVSNSGAGIFNTGTATITSSLINDNFATRNGGNIYSGDSGGISVLNISLSTVIHGLALENGGGIYNDGGLNIANSTVTTNRAVSGDGIYSVEITQPMTLTNVTLAYNTNDPVNPGEGIANSGAPISLKNTLIAGNGTQGNCAGSFASAGYNLEYGDTCGLHATGDITGTDPLLGLIVYDSSTAFYPLLPGSPATNGGTNAGCPAVDQRGWTRPHGAYCDIGAFETNDAPRAVADSYITDEDTQLAVSAPGLLANDSDLDNDVITATLLTTPAHGALTLNQSGAFSYTPNANYHGQDSFSYRLDDGFLSSASTLVTLTVISVNDPPIAGNDAASTPIDTTLSIPAAMLLSNDTDIESDPLTISAVRSNSARRGRVVLAGSSVVYTPPAHFNGVDSLIYTLSDSTGGTASGTVTVTVGARLLYLPMARR